MQMAAAYATRLNGSPEGPRKRLFRSFRLARISCAVARSVAFELRRGARILRARAAPM